MTEEVSRIRELAGLVEIAVFVGLLYVAYLAPYMVLRGTAERKWDYLAAALGIGFWALGISSNVEVFG